MQELTVGGDFGEIERAAAWLTGLAERGLVPSGLLYDMQLCLEEALANIVMHGLEGVAEPRIRLRLTAQGRHLALEIADNGGAFDVSTFAAAPPARTLEGAATGGRGIALMRQFSAGLCYAREADGNILTLRFDSDLKPGGSSARGK